MLLAPLPGRERRPTPVEAEAEGAAFMDLMGKTQGGRLRGNPAG
jgi:hypothetical protein